MTESADMHGARFVEPPRPVIREARLLDQVRAAIRYRHYSYRTEQVYVEWIRRYVLFHGKRHPSPCLPLFSRKRVKLSLV